MYLYILPLFLLAVAPDALASAVFEAAAIMAVIKYMSFKRRNLQ